MDSHIKSLIGKYADGTLSEAETSVLAGWVRRSKANAVAFKMELREIHKNGTTTVQAAAFWQKFASEKLIKKRGGAIKG